MPNCTKCGHSISISDVRERLGCFKSHIVRDILEGLCQIAEGHANMLMGIDQQLFAQQTKPKEQLAELQKKLDEARQRVRMATDEVKAIRERMYKGD